MGCFCHSSPPAGLLASLNLSASVALPGADIPLSLSAWLNLRGLPALPWEPLPNWLVLPLPSLQLNLRAVATISALAQLRAQVLAQFGLDLLIPGQALMFVRIVATMNARLSALVHLNFNPLAWLRLAGLNAAIDQINLALRLGLLLPSPSLMLSLTLPGGIPMPQWAGFLALLRALLPMIAAAANLNVSLTETAQFSAALRDTGEALAAGSGGAATDGEPDRRAERGRQSAGEPRRQSAAAWLSGDTATRFAQAERAAGDAVRAVRAEPERRRRQSARGTAGAAAEPAVRADEFCHQRDRCRRRCEMSALRLAELAGAAVAAGDRDRPADLRLCRLAECRAGASGGAVRAVRAGLRCGAGDALSGDGHGGVAVEAARAGDFDNG